jgi:hypothetical protein
MEEVLRVTQDQSEEEPSQAALAVDIEPVELTFVDPVSA